MQLNRLFAYLRLLCLAALLAGALPAHAQNTCQSRTFNAHEERVLAAYIAYYGRPADTGGLAYWAGKVAANGGRLDAIIDAFGNSSEYRQRFGSLSNRELIRNLYQQLYGRDPDPAGWAFYENLLNTKAQSLASIAISIMDGTGGGDVAVLDNRKAVVRHFIARMESLGAAAPAITDGNLLASLLAATTADPATAASACQRINDLLGGGGDLIAGRYQPIEGGSVIRDTVNGLEWQRCSVGQRWNDTTKSCNGTAAEYDWNSAIQLTAAGGFRIPTLGELGTLVYCSTGMPKQFGPLSKYEGCSGSYSKPTVVSAAFPNMPSSGGNFPFWSDSLDTTNSAWVINFYSGYTYLGSRSSMTSYFVRLVRAAQSFASLPWAPTSPIAPALAHLKGYGDTPPNTAFNDTQGQRQVFTAGLDASGLHGLHDLHQQTPLDAAGAAVCCAALSADGRYLAWQETGLDGRVQARLLELASDASATLDWPQGEAAQALHLSLSADGAQLHWLAAPVAGQDAAPLYGADNPLFVPATPLQ